MESLGDRVKRRRAELDMTQMDLAHAAALKQSDISKIERGLIRKTTAIVPLARALQCSPDYLVSGIELGPAAMPHPTNARVPLISWVKAGNWSDVTDPFQPGEADDWVDIDGLAAGPHAFALTVTGDSMTSTSPGERSFPEGTILIVDPSRASNAGDYVIAKDVDTQRATFKRLTTDGSRWYLRPINTAYPTIEIDDPSIRVIGKVIEYQFRGRL